MSQKSDVYQPKSVIWRDSNYAVHLGQVLGVLDFDNNFDNTFQKWKLTMQFITDVREAIKQKIIPDFEKNNQVALKLDEVAIMKLEKIWNGQTFLGIIRNQDQTIVHMRELYYEKPKGNYQQKDKTGKVVAEFPRELIPMPRLKNMLPVGKSDGDTWGIQIRETMQFKYAFEGADYLTVIKEGKFEHYLSDGIMPKFQQSDMSSLTMRTSMIHRPVYNAIMDILPRFFNQNYFIFAGNVQRILTWMNSYENTDDDDYDTDNLSTTQDSGLIN